MEKFLNSETKHMSGMDYFYLSILELDRNLMYFGYMKNVKMLLYSVEKINIKWFRTTEIITEFFLFIPWAMLFCTGS